MASVCSLNTGFRQSRPSGTCAAGSVVAHRMPPQGVRSPQQGSLVQARSDATTAASTASQSDICQSHSGCPRIPHHRIHRHGDVHMALADHT